MPTDYADLVPSGAARQIIAATKHESVVLRLANVTPVPRSNTSVPIVSLEPGMGFVAAGGRKPASSIEWSAEHLIAEEIATTLAIPDAFIEDDAFPVWDEVRPRVAGAIAKAFDAAVRSGKRTSSLPISLMPQGGIVERYARGEGEDAFGVSREALRWRLFSLGLVSEKPVSQ